MFPFLAAMTLAAADTPPAPPTPPAPAETVAPADSEGQKATVVEIHTIRQVGDGAAPTPPRTVSRKLACTGQKYEFQASTGEGKEKHNSRIVLCSDKDASKEKVTAMLEDAARRLETNQQLPAANRDKIVADVRARIAELKASN